MGNTSAVMSVETSSGRKKMHTISDLSKEQRKFFCKMVDECVLDLDDNDEELKDGFRYLDELALHKNMSFYDLILQLYEMSEINERIEEWKKEKGFK